MQDKATWLRVGCSYRCGGPSAWEWLEGSTRSVLGERILCEHAVGRDTLYGTNYEGENVE